MTIVLEIVVVALVVYGLVAFGLGRVGGMSTAPPDSGDVGLPPGRIAPEAIDRTRFGLAFRGYRMAEVDGVLDRLRDEVASRDAELADLRGDGNPHPTADGAPGPTRDRPDDEELSPEPPGPLEPERPPAPAGPYRSEG